MATVRMAIASTMASTIVVPFNCGAQPSMPATTLSERNTIATCRKSDCIIPILVEVDSSAGCTARVEIETHRILKKASFRFEIYKQVADANDYALLDDGIDWVPDPGIPNDTPQKAAQRAKDHFDSGPHDHHGSTLTGKHKQPGKGDLHYFKPKVQKTTGGQAVDCVGNDPRIANDGS